MSEAILEAVESVRLPSMPQVLLRFLRMVEDDRTSMQQLADLVGQDPSLSARILTVANSAALRQITAIKNLEQCMVALGTRLARTIAACLAVQSVFASTTGEDYDFKGFWRHSLWVGETARQIATEIGYEDIEEAYLAGLLHDVGELLLLGGLGENYQGVLNKSRDEAALQINEQTDLGADHAQVGAWLMDQWKLSSFMADAVLFHHMSATEIAAADTLSRLVWSSHAIVEQGGVSEIASADLAATETMLGLSFEQTTQIRARASEEVALLAEALGINVSAEAKSLPASPVVQERRRTKSEREDPARTAINAAVRDMAMLQPFQQQLSTLLSEDELLLAVRESARIIFGLGRLAFLFPKGDQEVLTGAAIPGQPLLLQRLEVSLSPPQSLAAAAALGEQPRVTFRPGAMSLVDVQIARALESEGLLYVPMRSRGKPVGLMAYGLTTSQHARAKKQMDWMTSFAQAAAVSLETWREIRDREQAIEERISGRIEHNVRKIAHEAGNPLAIIRNYLSIVKQRLPEDSEVAEEMSILSEEVERVTQILGKVSKRGEKAAPPASIDVNAVIEGMLALYGDPLFAETGITLEKSLTPGIAPIAGDRDSLKQILLNLWKNASEALPEGSSIHVATRDNVDHKGCPHVEIVVSDTGPGLPLDVLQGLFKPLNPNRREGHSGLGLSIVSELVERLKGEITCQSEEGWGTTFFILLPQAPFETK